MQAVVALLIAVVASAQAAPLPDAASFFAATRNNLARAGRVQDVFAYRERRTELYLNPFGRLGTGGVVLYEVTPVAGGIRRRVLERDGMPVANSEVERVEQRRPRERTQSASSIDDTAAALDLVIDRRELIAGRQVIVVKFTPKPDAHPKTRAGRMAHAFRGEIWVDEVAHEVTRVEAVAVEALSYGLGVLARLAEGTRVTVVRGPVADGIWLPTSIKFKGEGRALLLRKLNLDFGVEWFDYRQVLDAPPPS